MTKKRATGRHEPSQPRPSRRQPEPRSFLGARMSEGFRDGELGSGLTVRKVMADADLAALAFEVREQIREQFAPATGDDGAAPGSQSPEELEAYRTKLEFWANLFETLLRETVSELDRLGPGKRHEQA